MKLLPILLCCLFLSSSSYATDLEHAKVLRVIDGDTFTIEPPTPDKLLGEFIAVRIYGIDAPELHSENLCEKSRAIEAKNYLFKLLTNADVSLKNIKHDKYFRLLAEVFVSGKPVSELMIKNKFAVPYFGEKKKKVDWCNGEGP